MKNASRPNRQTRPDRAPRRAVSLASGLAACLAVAGCLSGGSAGSPGKAATPARVTQFADPAAMAGQANWPAAGWWDEFNDAGLSAQIRLALDGNPAMAVAGARIRAALAQQQATGASQSPTLTANADASRQRFSGQFIYPPPLAGSQQTVARAALDFNWEIDFWGRQRALLDASIGQTRAAVADREQASLLLSSAVAVCWINLAADLTHVAVGREQLVIRQAQATLLERRLAAGLENRIAADQAQARVEALQLALERLDQRLQLTRHQLASLTASPSSMNAAPADPASLLAHLSTAAGPGGLVPADLPLELVARRPDLAAQLERINSAARRVDSARAEFYPSVNLAAFVGLQSIGLANLLSRDARITSVGPALRLPILEGGRLRAQLALQQADFDATVEQYNATLLTAVREVAEQLTSLHSGERQRQLAQAELGSRQRQQTLSRQRQQAGLDSRLPVDEQRATRLDTEQSMTDIQANLAIARVGLIKALGGGFHQAGTTRSP